jgi:hypothetical protein
VKGEEGLLVGVVDPVFAHVRRTVVKHKVSLRCLQLFPADKR